MLASEIGLRGALWVSVVGATLALVPLAFSSVRQIRTLPETESVEPALPEPPQTVGVRADA